MLPEILARLAAVPARLTNTLTDPARRERAMIAVLSGYVAVWALYGTIQKSAHDMHFDMVEQYAWSQELDFGFWKHPPFAAAVARVWFSIFPRTGWAFYLLAMTTAGLALWIAWRLFERYLDPERRVVALVLLMLTPFFHFHALKYNVNTVLLPLWAATTLFFLRSLETRSLFHAALAGILAAASMYGKYWSAVLLFGLAAAALTAQNRAAYFRSAAPWVTIAAGFAVIAPHLVWLYTNDFAPFKYALNARVIASHSRAALVALIYLAGAAAYAALAVAAALWTTQRSPGAVRDMIWPSHPSHPSRRVAVVAFAATLLAPVFLALGSLAVQPIWTMPAWTLLPVVLLGTPLVRLKPGSARRAVTLALAIPFVALAAASLVAYQAHKRGSAATTIHAARIGAELDRLWRETTDAPLTQVATGEEYYFSIRFYAPPAWKQVSYVFIGPNAFEKAAPVEGRGAAIACPVEDQGCVGAARAVAANSPTARSEEITLVRRWLGIDGKPRRYLLFAVPPR